MRRGQTVSIDFAIAMTIFIMMVIGGIFLLQRVTQPRTGFGTQVRDAAETAVDGFKDETEWTVFRTPVFVRSNRSLSDEPVTVATPFPGAVVAQSVLVMDGGTERPSQHNISGNETVVVTDLSEGTDRLDLVYTESGTLSDRSYDTGLASSGDMVWNSKVNLTFTDTGLSRLSFNGTGLLQSNADLDGSASPTVEQRPVRVNITYSTGRKHVRMFAESGQIRITEFFTGERDWQLNLSSSFDTLYSAEAGGLVDLDTAGTGIYTASTDWVDFNSSSRGLSIIGSDMFVNVSRDSSNAKLEVRMNFSDTDGRKDILIYPHAGGYPEARPQKNDFYDPYSHTVGAPAPREGVRRAEADSLEAESYEEVKDRLGLGQLEYNITVGTVFRKGRDVNPGRTTTAFTFPLTRVDRFGNASRPDMELRVWR